MMMNSATHGWIDVHTHLNMLKTTPEEALAEGRAAGVSRFITIGTEPKDHGLVLELARRYFPEVACTLGVHPHEAQLFTDEVSAFIETHAKEKEVVAIGEIGLDYYYDNSPREVQREAFRRQLEIAAKLGMPIEIHTRDAEPDTIEILGEFKGRLSGIVHCFTGTMELAKAALDLGLDISFSGVVTFKNADDLRAVASYVPLERLHVETDAPFLTPVPHRGKPNVPAFVVHTGRFVANLKGVSEDLLRETTVANARRVFPKLAWT
jgi:TatD DNase family protein